MKRLLAKLFLWILNIIVAIWPVEANASNLVQAGKTDCGMLYVDIDTVEVLKKDSQYFLLFAAEEKFTDTEFLQALHSDEDLATVTSAYYLYMFNSSGIEYYLLNKYLLDDAGKVVVDLSEEAKAIVLRREDIALLRAYAISLKVVDKKKKIRRFY
ncbi:MAG: hypothetical protein Q4P09_07660 [Phascolarctobacterium sp.]|nr:hypothetical protein [Phascolarctobacterium sp.]